ncbi:MAG: type II toxin-antitoxin system HicA family toxin [Deltaproteobacteria bacterium]|nr:type II toxin-antitoxin system HicA family toxin [Deltaproteobacteria bacterium]
MGEKLPVVKPKNAIRALEKAGLTVVRQRGSHVVMKHPARPDAMVVVPHHVADIKRGTLKNILKQANLSVDEFVALLNN